MLSQKCCNKFTGIRTPFYFYDIGLLRQTLDSVKKCAEMYGYFVHYAMKANNDNYLLEIINEYGFGVDCVSGNEIERALNIGFKPDTIVYAGVGKRDIEIEYAINKGIYALVCESIEEIFVVNQIAKLQGKTANIALRINPDIDPKTLKHITTGTADSKFGIPYECVENNLCDLLRLSNVNIIGIHFHIGSQIRDCALFIPLCDKINSITKRLDSLGVRLSFIDAGGGLGVNYETPEQEIIPNFKAYFNTFNTHLQSENIPVHFELGRSIVGQCGELITKVLFSKQTSQGTKMVIVDASMTELIRPALYGVSHSFQNLTSSDREKETYTIVGTVCESTDIFEKNALLPLTKRGDLLSIKTAGAYGMSMASRYNLHDLPGAVYSDQL